MKKILLGSVATGALVAAGSASAADLGQRPAYKAPPVAAPVPVFSWTGCFVGAHGGWGWSRKDVRVSSNSHSGPGNGTATGGLDSSGAIFGGQIGCDYQFGFGKGPGSAGAWVIGIQGDFAGARLTGDIPTPLHAGPTATAHTFLRTDWLSSVTGRVGITGWLPRTLLYIRGGGAWMRENWTVVDTDFGSSLVGISQTRAGWTIGGGIEYAIAPNWSIFAEFNHYDFGTKNLVNAATTHSSTVHHFLNVDVRQRVEAVRLGVNYRFNWGKGKAPVVAKY